MHIEDLVGERLNHKRGEMISRWNQIREHREWKKRVNRELERVGGD